MKNVLQVMNEINNKYRFSVETSHILIGDQTHDLLKIEIEELNEQVEGLIEFSEDGKEEDVEFFENKE